MTRIHRKVGSILDQVRQLLTDGSKSEAKQVDQSDAAPGRAPLLRPIVKTSHFYLEQTRSIWRILVLSLPLDFCLLIPDLTGLSSLPQLAALLDTTVWALAFVCLLFLVRESAIDLMLNVGELQRKILRYSIPIAIVLVLLVFIEMVTKFGDFDLPAVLLALVITFGAAQSIWRVLKERKQLLQRLHTDKSLWIETTNFKVYLICIIPLFAARLLSLVGILHGAIFSEPFGMILSYYAAGTLLLIAYEPREHHFMITCRVCAQKTSRALQSSGLCPRCGAKSRAS